MEYRTSAMCFLFGLFTSLAACGGGGAPITSTSPPPTPVIPEFLYATPTSGNEVAAFSIDPASGQLTAVASIAGPNIGVPAVDPTGNFLYVSDTYYNDQVYGYSINPKTGALSNLPGSPFVFETTSGTGVFFGIAIHPSGKFLYYDHGLTVGIGNAQIDGSTGALSSGSFLFVPATTQILGAAFDPAGKFLFAGNHSDPLGNDFLVFNVDPNSGSLTQVPGSPFTLDANSEPYGIAVHPSGALLYAALADSLSSQTSGIAAMTIDPSTGTLSWVPGSPFSAGIGFAHIAMNPLGSFLYAITSTDNNVYALAINQQSGILTPVSGSPFPAGRVPLALAFDPLGQFLMVGNSADSTISVFLVNPSSGMLTPVPGSPFPAGIPIGYLATARPH